MSSFDKDLESLETAMRLFFQTMKRPQLWANVTSKAGVNIDRPATHILHALMLPKTEGWRVQDLANLLGIEAPSITRKTQKLELSGYLERTRNLQDKRAIGMRITPKGRSVCTKIWNAQRQTIAEVLNNWPEVERQKFVKLFEKFANELAAEQQTVIKTIK
jgi:DNA-binding MarR family transcriptional regulator